MRQLGRLSIEVEGADFSRVFGRVHVWLPNIERCARYTELDFSSDQAHERIAATSVVHRIPLLTRDAKIRKLKSVPLARA